MSRAKRPRKKGVKGGKPTPRVHVVYEPDEPFENAKLFLKEHYWDGQNFSFYFHRDQFFVWNGITFPGLEEPGVLAKLWEFFAHARHGKKRFKPNRAIVSNIFEALKAVAYLPDSHCAPCWLRDESRPAHEFIVLQNGLLHLPSRKLLPHTSAFFAHNALPFSYDPHALAPVGWFRFLESIWSNDAESIETLQEIMGFLLLADTSHHKIFLFVGPRRSGKGTIARIIRKLVGEPNYAGLTLSTLATQFGLADLISKPVAVIPDARLSDRMDQRVVVERLLSISGADPLPVDRKFRSVWNGALPTRIVILTNEMPRLRDTSGALAGRFIVLCFPKSFYGQEDLGLEGRIGRELPGILNWCLEGAQRLLERGHFKQPRSSAEALEELYTLSSPLRAFVDECCEVGAGLWVTFPQLYDFFKDWAGEAGWKPIPDRHTFGRDLRALIPALRVSQPRVGGRVRRYIGITLKSLARNGTRANSPIADKEGEPREPDNSGEERVPPRATEITDVEEGIL
jgi:putative DNA primase/helicase